MVRIWVYGVFHKIGGCHVFIGDGPRQVQHQIRWSNDCSHHEVPWMASFCALGLGSNRWACPKWGPIYGNANEGT